MIYLYMYTKVCDYKIYFEDIHLINFKRFIAHTNKYF
jgi:hypothetical protein